MEVKMTVTPHMRQMFMHCETVTMEIPEPEEFRVIAGHYETGYSDDENQTFISEPCTMAEALKLWKQHSDEEFCFVEHQPTGARLQVVLHG